MVSGEGGRLTLLSPIRASLSSTVRFPWMRLVSRQRFACLFLALAFLAGCASAPRSYRDFSTRSGATPEARQINSADTGSLIARSSDHQKVGRPYTISGHTYVPRRDDNYDETGLASWYGPNFHGRPTANGEIFDQNLMTAAHPTLPIPSIAEVTNLENGRQVIVRINDRGPFVDDRMIDLSRGAATQLDFIGRGLARVRVRYLGPAHARASAPQSGYMMAGQGTSRPARPEPLPAALPVPVPAPVMPLPQPVAMSSPSPAVASAPATELQIANTDDLAPLSALPPGSDPAAGMEVAPLDEAAPAPEPVREMLPQSAALAPVDRITIQIGAFSSPVNADRFAQRISSLGEVRIVQGDVGGRPIWRVFVGEFDSHLSAAEFQLRLQDAGIAESRITPLG